MIGKKDLEKIIESCRNAGYDIRVRDIAYAILTERISDKNISYLAVFGIEHHDISEYDNSSAMSYLRNYLKFNASSKNNKKSNGDGISFEENKSEMEKLIKRIQEAMDNGEMEVKDGLKQQADIRVRLNDKFRVTEDVKEQVVIVETKMNAVCEYCNHEIHIPTKKELMDKYDLIER